MVYHPQALALPCLAWILGIGLGTLPPAWGQNSDTDPGRFPQDLPPLQPPQSDPVLPELPPNPEVSPDLPRESPPGTEVTFILQAIHLDGSTRYTPGDLASLYAPLLGTPITLAALEALAHRLTMRYRQDGYLLSRVIVPPQTVAAGVVRLQAIEGWIEGVTVESQGPVPLGVTAHLEAVMAPLPHHRPLRWDILERLLLLGQSIPGLTLTSVLIPGSEPGTSRLILRPRHAPVQGAIALDSYGSDTLGPLRLQSALFFNGTLGGAEQVSFSWGTTPGVLGPPVGPLRPGQFRSTTLGVTWPLGAQGWELVAQGGYSDLRPGGTLTPFGLEGELLRGSVGLRYDWVRQRQATWTVEATAEFYGRTSRTTRLNPAALLSQDQQGVLRLAVVGLHRDSLGTWNLDLNWSQGIAGHLGSPDRPLSRQDGSPYFTRLRGTVTRRLALGRGGALELGAVGQWSDRPLLVGEQLGLGGAPFGRAFLPSQALGDRGFGLRAELQGWLPLGATGGLQPYGFYDYGQVWRDRPTVVESASTTLSSLGLGVRAGLGTFLLADLTLAFPLLAPTHTPAQVFFSLQTAF